MQRYQRVLAFRVALSKSATVASSSSSSAASTFVNTRYFSSSSPTFSADKPTRVCVVGSGPGGFYTAKYLLKDDPNVHVDIIDLLPTPYGLVRSGVAPDHPEVKQVTNDFEQVASEYASRFKFLGNVAVGKDVGVKELLARYNAVVLAYGAASDRTMGVPGEDKLEHVYSARAFVNWYNGHPDFRSFQPNLDAEDVVIVGQGNVAIDCARILTKTVKELSDSDIAAHALEALSKSKVKRVHVVGRRGHVQAAFTMKELREVTKLDEATCVVKTEELERGRNESSKQELEKQRARKRMDALLQEVAVAAEKNPLKAKQLILRFLLSPSAVVPSGKNPNVVGGLEMDITRLEGPAESQSAVATGKKEILPAGMILRSIGYKSVALPDVPFDTKKSVVKNIKGRAMDTSTEGSGAQQVAGLYCTGWLKRGPSGIIGTNITCARETVSSILEDKAANKLSTITVPEAELGMGGLVSLIASRGKKPVSQLVPWTAWNKIDAAEQANGKAVGKPREKFTSVADMIKAGQ